MKNTKWVGLVTVLAFPLLSGYGQAPEAAVPGTQGQAQVAAPVNLSPGAAEVLRLAAAGVSDDVVLAYIQNSQAPFGLSADDVLYLKDVGLSPQVTSAMLTHDTTLRGQAQQYAPAGPATPPPAGTAAPAPAVPPGTAPLTYDWQSPVAPTTPAPTKPPPPATAPTPAYVTTAPADVSYFYNDLSPYGTWVSLEGYGWCWQPRTVVISRGWRPYCDGGHWVYSDLGWYWQSDYSWGWAPFHYGRWHMHPSCGWVWMPDRVWGPAWVTWRTGGDVCGWAPLPPRASFDVRLGWRFNGVTVGANFDFGLGVNAFAFVGFGDFCNHNLAPRCLPPARVTTIYRQTTVINNYAVNNTTIVHRGIPIERVSAASHTPVPRATVRDLPAGSARMPSRTPSVVYRAQLQAPARPLSMAAQRLDERHPVVQHAPIAPTRMQQPSTLSRSGSAPAAAARRPVMESPKISPWSSPARPSSPPQYSPTARTTLPAPITAPPKASPGSSGARPSSSPQYSPTARTTLPAPITASPKASPLSSSVRPTPSAQLQSTANTYRPAPTAAAAPAAPRAPEDWKQGTRIAPGYRGAPAPAQTSSQAQNPHVYYPKSAHQAAEVRALPPLDQAQSASSSFPGRSQDSRSGKNQ